MKMKKRNNTEKLVYELAEPIAKENGSSIWDVRFEKEGASWYLRVFIDKAEGVSIDDCEAVSRPLSDILDEKDPIPQAYFLEVGSAGIERELIRQSHFEASAGKVITVKLYSAENGVKEFKGRLSGYGGEGIRITNPFNADDDEKEIPLEKISSVRLADDVSEEI